MSRIGKIARLPHEIREQLNRRLRDGQSGTEILPWVNQLPECQQMLAEKFGGRPIDDNNLYEWRHAGYEEWLWHEDRRDIIQSYFEHIAKLGAAGDPNQVGEQLSAVLAAELAKAIGYLEAFSDMSDRWHMLRQVSRELSRFRRENYNQQRLRLAEKRFVSEQQRQNEHLQPEKTAETNQPTPTNTIPLNSANSG